MPAQVFYDLLNISGPRTRKDEEISRAFPGCRHDDQIFREELWFVGNHHSFELYRFGKWTTVFARDKAKLFRLFGGRYDGAEQIRRNSPAAAAQARRCPRNIFAEHVLLIENLSKLRRQRNRQL